ncbi:FAD-dependent monooxygenase [Nonomuraea dietziae]|uniref:2-polyprenyl-6-methoxyphenol hydroxylase-like FAD-dependent oxidoreductase n=1 Tax=Nonomuraea dietziae TaxID=65515 RepID=A0A7W5V6G0_9ACTN|nr:FAD-dependent monooxygenase [Nonomuraea dietziae]MBB3728816.1 2-polyprenyl-6-methoxyphenol hydroxylase-like FAD-dependent oxidoreductase [Nonomuraea dietziae]
MTNILISGSSIAGATLAYWLRHHGFSTTVVERTPGLRPGGQAIDVRGAALTVAERMGVLDEMRGLRTTWRGMSMLDGDGNEVMRDTEGTYSGGRFDSGDVELLKEDLTRIVHDRARDGVEYLFDDTVTSIGQDGEVTFENSPPRRFDLVIGADGLHSTVRRLAFGDESDFIHHLGMHLCIFTMDNILDLENWQIWLRDGDAGLGLFPVRDNTQLKVNLGFHKERLDYDYRDLDQQRRLVAEHCGGLRWEAPRLLEAMWKAPDFYFDSMAQIRMPSWSKGRVALVGDAGYCASPLSGQGTSLAMVGAYVLAEELGRSLEGAFDRYESRMRPFVEANQALALENPGGPASDESVAKAKNAITL